MAKIVDVVIKDEFQKAYDVLEGHMAYVVKGAAFSVEGHAKMLCPVDTGRLKNSIRTEMETPISWIVAPHTHYAAFVEFGTSKMAARPYMRPAAERVARSIKAVIKSAKL